MIGQKGIPALFGGVERHVEELAARLVERGHQVTVYTRPYFTSPRRRAHRKINLVSLPTFRTKHLDAISHTFFATIHAIRHDYDVIHYHGVGPSLLSWMPRVFRPRAKVISTFHCIDRKHQKWGFIARTCLRLGEAAATYFPHRTIGVSRSIKRYCQSVFNHRIDYIPNGVEVIPARASDSRQVFQRFGLRPGEYVLAVTRLIPHKGIHYLIQAFKTLPTSKKLVIVGDSFFTDTYVKDLKALAKNDARIVFTGWQRGIPLRQLYRGATMFVLPSETEGLPLTLLEAAGYGVPILASDIPENLEILHGQSVPIGFTFQNKNMLDLRAKLMYLLAHPKQLTSVRQQARRVVATRYQWDAIAEQTEQLYRRADQTNRKATPIAPMQRVLVTNQA